MAPERDVTAYAVTIRDVTGHVRAMRVWANTGEPTQALAERWARAQVAQRPGEWTIEPVYAGSRPKR